MRIVAHLISVLLLLPGLFVTAAIAGLSYLAVQSSPLGLFTALLDLAIAFFPLAFLFFVVWFALALTGFSSRFRRAGAIAVGGIAAATTAFALWRTGTFDGGLSAVAFPDGVFVPGALALAIAIWLATTEWPDRRERRNPARPPAIARPE